MKSTIITVMIVVLLGVGFFTIYPRIASNYDLGPNAKLIEGTCVIINWDASEGEGYKAIEKWLSIKRLSK